MAKNNFDDVFYPENIEEILFKDVDVKMVDHVIHANMDHMRDIAMTFMGVEISYQTMIENIIDYAKALKQYGLDKGDCVTMALPNIPETIYYIYACNLIGVTAYPIDPRCSFNYMLECINNSKSKLFICEMGTYFSKVARYSDKLPVDNKIVVSPVHTLSTSDNLDSKLKIAKYLYAWKQFTSEIKSLPYGKNGRLMHDDFIKKYGTYNSILAAEYDPDIPAMIVNTSGTTGTFVKGAMHSNRNYNVYANEAQFVTKHLVRGNTYYSYIPYFTMYGSCVGMHVALSHGVIINNIPKFNGVKSLQEIIDTKANILIAVPPMMEKLVDMYEQQNLDASHVKQYIIGGDNLSPDKLEEENQLLLARGMQCRMVYGYGATECMPVSTTNYDEISYTYGSCGMIYPMAYVKIIDPETLEELENNEEGEIYVHNPTLMMGYLNHPEENSLVLKEIDGKIYYKTGDKGYLTPNGYLFLTGRYKRMMKRPDSHQVSPIPIENAIIKDPLVDDCAVVGITRNNGGNGVIPTAFIVLNKQEISENIEDLIRVIAEDALQNVSGEREAALAYVVVDKIPTTMNGKVDFNILQQNVFDDLTFYIIDDIVTREYFANFPNAKFIKLNKGNVRSLKK